MRNIFLYFLIISSSFSLFSQEKNDVYSFEFNNIPLTEVIQTIETKTQFKFYYEKEWLNEDKKMITGSYKNVTIDFLLDVVFTNTELNFFIQKNKIILTKNNVIHDQLAADFFGKSKKSNENLASPIFYQQYDSISKGNISQKGDILFIGKESQMTDKKFYTVTGYITNDMTGKPESNVLVKVRNKGINTETDDDGFFKLQLPVGANIIETKSFNFKKTTQTLVVYSDGEINLSVTENKNQLNEVNVKNNRSKKVESVLSGVVSIDIEQMKNIPMILGERDILKLATTFPGIKTTGEGSAGFNVRGGKDDQNLILVDNAVIYNPQHFFGIFSAINPYTTKSATIYKASIPTEYGGRLSSVFDIKTKNGNQEKFSGEGAIGPVTSNLSLSIPIEQNKSGIMFGGRATYSDWVLKSLKNEELKNSQAGFYDLNLKYNNTFNEKNALETTLYYSHDNFSLSTDSIYSYSNTLASVKWKHIFNAKNKVDFYLTDSQYKYNIDFSSTGKNTFESGYKLNEIQLLANFGYLYNEKHNFAYGISSKLYNINPGYLTPTKPESTLIPVNLEQEKGLESALYISDTFKVNKKLSFDLGLRYSMYAALGPATVNSYESGLPLSDATITGTETYANNEVEKTYGFLEPRIAARYLINEDLSIKGGYDKTSQYIHLLSSNVTQTPTDTWILSNTNIKPQSAQQVSLGVFKNLDNAIYEVSVEGYYKTSENLLDYKVGSQLLLNENVETELLQGEGKAYGIEFLVKKSIGRLNGWIGYTYSRTFIKLDSEFNAEKVNNGNYFPTNYDKPHDLSMILNYKFTNRYSLSTNFLYQTGRPITYPVGTYTYNNAVYTLYSDRNEFRIPDYFRLDIGINIEGNHKIKKLAHSFWNISVYNLLARSNPYSIYFITDDTGSIKAYKTSIFSVPIPSITYNFRF